MSAQPNVGDIYPALTYDDAPAAINWLCEAFGFTRRLVVPGEGNRVEHSELTLGNALVMVSSPKPDDGRLAPGGLAGASQTLCVHIDDPDAHFAAATSAGAEVIRPLEDEGYGSRGYMCKDREGHIWYFGTYRPGEHWE